MARVAYVDHSFHQKTRSTDFLVQAMVARWHQVDRFWDDSWRGGAPVAWDSVSGHDVVIMFQAYCPIEGGYFRQRHPNVVYVPMLDQFALWRGPHTNQTFFWEQWQGSKVLSFSTAQHAMACSIGIASHRARYYQPPRERAAEFDGCLRGFFWLRREPDLPWATIKALIADSECVSVHIHMVVDPGSPAPQPPSAQDVARYGITTSTWFEDKAELDKIIDNANLFFAPRLGEGIGQSFLEAFARGQCVVAADEGTMNEYIVSGVNGLLYDQRNPCALDLSDARQLGEAARRAAHLGYLSWTLAEDQLVDFVMTPSEQFYRGKYHHLPALEPFARSAAEATQQTGAVPSR